MQLIQLRFSNGNILVVKGNLALVCTNTLRQQLWQWQLRLRTHLSVWLFLLVFLCEGAGSISLEERGQKRQHGTQKWQKERDRERAEQRKRGNMVKLRKEFTSTTLWFQKKYVGSGVNRGFMHQGEYSFRCPYENSLPLWFLSQVGQVMGSLGCGGSSGSWAFLWLPSPLPTLCCASSPTSQSYRGNKWEMSDILYKQKNQNNIKQKN